MIIREADFSRDWPAIVAGMWDFYHFAGAPGWVPEDRETFETIMLDMLRNPVFRIFLAEDQGQAVAGIGVSQMPFMMNPEFTMIEELFWWSTDEAPPLAAARLLRHTVEWAKTTPGRVLLMMKALDNSPPGVERSYQKLGLNHVERTYIGELL